MTMRYVYMLTAITTVLTAFSIGAHADSVVLKNGHVLDGIIERETDKVIVLNIGVGSTTFRKSQVSEIIRSKNADRIRNHWREQNFYRTEYVPEGYEALAKKFRTVLEQRNAALKSAIRVDAFKRMEQASGKEVDAIKAELKAVNEKLREGKETLPETEFKAFTKQIEELHGKLDAANAKKSGYTKDSSSSGSSIASYKKARSTLLSEHAQAAQGYDEGPAAEFLALMGNELDKFKHDFTGARARTSSPSRPKPSSDKPRNTGPRPSGPTPGGAPPGFSGPPPGFSGPPTR